MNYVYEVVILLETQGENFMLNISWSYMPAQQSKIGFIIVYVFTYVIYVPPILDYILVKLSIILCLCHEIQAQDSTDVHGHIVLHIQLEYMKNRDTKSTRYSELGISDIYTHFAADVHCICYWYEVMLNHG
jgi:hypothetical protein